MESKLKCFYTLPTKENNPGASVFYDIFKNWPKYLAKKLAFFDSKHS
jgi:hypothetical protein